MKLVIIVVVGGLVLGGLIWLVCHSIEKSLEEVFKDLTGK